MAGTVELQNIKKSVALARKATENIAPVVISS